MRSSQGDNHQLAPILVILVPGAITVLVPIDSVLRKRGFVSKIAVIFSAVKLCPLSSEVSWVFLTRGIHCNSYCKD